MADDQNPNEPTVEISEEKLNKLIEYGEQYKKLSEDYKVDLDFLIDNLGTVIVDIQQNGIMSLMTKMSDMAASGDASVMGLDFVGIGKIVEKYKGNAA